MPQALPEIFCDDDRGGAQRRWQRPAKDAQEVCFGHHNQPFKTARSPCVLKLGGYFFGEDRRFVLSRGLATARARDVPWHRDDRPQAGHSRTRVQAGLI